ncbi:MAG: AMP-dependent synthetase/ligase [Solirubrobacteraceae bacterium]
MLLKDSFRAPPSLRTVADAFLWALENHPDEPALAEAGGSLELTWSEYAERVAALASGLRGLGVGAGDRVALLMGNRPEFNLIDSAAMFLGAIPLSIYTTSASEQIAYIAGHAEPAVFVVEAEARPRIEEAGITDSVFYIENKADGPSVLDRIEGFAREPVSLHEQSERIDPDDILTLIYTSGTTGPPKGVELSHAALLFAIRATLGMIPIPEQGRMISYLPHAHVVDRFTSHYLHMTTGSLVTTLRDAKEIFSVTPSIEPTMFFAVPRMWEKLRQSLTAELETGEEAEEFHAMLELGRRRVLAQHEGSRLASGDEEEWQALNESLGVRIRSRIGLQEASWLGTGSTKTEPELLRFLAALGIPVCENWGMSECCSVGTLNDPVAPRIGTVGTVLPGTELAIAADGEILCRGPHLMRGYRNDPDATAATIDTEGWLHTGDIGAFDEDGFLAIVDRKKEIIINSSGKNMSPTNIEATVRNASPLIGQVCCIGDARPFNTALIVLDPLIAGAVAAQTGHNGLGLGEIVALPAVRAAIVAAVEAANHRLARVEQIKRFRLLGDEWPADGGFVTPTMKLRRREVLRRYADIIEDLYKPEGDARTGIEQ